MELLLYTIELIPHSFEFVSKLVDFFYFVKVGAGYLLHFSI
jgi:hypothetical protein